MQARQRCSNPSTLFVKVTGDWRGGEAPALSYKHNAKQGNNSRWQQAESKTEADEATASSEKRQSNQQCKAISADKQKAKSNGRRQKCGQQASESRNGIRRTQKRKKGENAKSIAEQCKHQRVAAPPKPETAPYSWALCKTQTRLALLLPFLLRMFAFAPTGQS